MSNLIQWIEEAAAEEPILGVVIGQPPDIWYAPDLDPQPVLTWDEAKPTLDYDFYSGFGQASCHPVLAWTESRVIFITEYDGSTSVNSVPRNPQSCVPQHY